MFLKVLLIILTVLFALFVFFGVIALIKKPGSVYSGHPENQNPMQGRNVIFIPDESYPENADGVKGHLIEAGESSRREGFYERFVKRIFDVLVSFLGLVLLSPVFAVIMLSIAIDDPGPVFFTQKRVGKNKQYFKLHKFRSMKLSTPKNVPTHMLDNPEMYITRSGKFIRSHSLDELPQIWDIFVGNMSVIGPRPALYNQDLLIAERDRYGANDVRPGLTGWAQINGRDTIGLEEKAALDGEYVRKLSFGFDVKCFLGSLHVFRRDENIVEGAAVQASEAEENNKNSTNK